ncbi:aminoglycoside phosphotransferase family protein [Shewanella sp. 202IG2-18]|uniref:phosphotransferase enzyme family protein n=1 Tax=Parashewanella hymeniacidonis TaxID=2807618 RepID=UPI00195F5F43|nr:aminoglycoside phosphotransferase family protein [Parashewanella hymeniacidonis]MBM7074176.1 aminoglycoside phosphotransferase family protein [Parashewanella hymeniacidonis]
MMESIRQQILPYYLSEAEIERTHITEIGRGHINHTWLVQSVECQFVLQKINTQVFEQPWTLMHNLQQLHQCLSDREVRGEYRLRSIGYRQTLQQESAVEHPDLGFWRALDYIDNSYSIDVVESAEQAYQAAKAFGHFSAQASHLPSSGLIDVIADFHDLNHRFKQLKTAIDMDVKGRGTAFNALINDVLSQQWLIEDINEVVIGLPLRVCHNDTKINNLLFDTSSHQVSAVIDLDTCMSGYLMYDFGDMIRTFCSPMDEDSIEYEKVIARDDIFESVVQGYFSELGDVLTQNERKSLWLGALAMPLMLCVRFLTDHLNGDQYFKVKHSKHNIHRAMNQWHLFKSLLKKEQGLKKFLFEAK